MLSVPRSRFLMKLQAEGHVLLDGQVGEEGVMLEDHVDRAAVGGDMGHFHAVD